MTRPVLLDAAEVRRHQEHAAAEVAADVAQLVNRISAERNRKVRQRARRLTKAFLSGFLYATGFYGLLLFIWWVVGPRLGWVS